MLTPEQRAGLRRLSNVGFQPSHSPPTMLGELLDALEAAEQERDAAKAVVESLSARVAAQAELLAKRAEKTP